MAALFLFSFPTWNRQRVGGACETFRGILRHLGASNTDDVKNSDIQVDIRY